MIMINSSSWNTIESTSQLTAPTANLDNEQKYIVTTMTTNSIQSDSNFFFLFLPKFDFIDFIFDFDCG